MDPDPQGLPEEMVGTTRMSLWSNRLWCCLPLFTGLCVKTSSLTDQQKVFVNICQSQEVPPPPALSQDALVELLESDDPTGYKVPMSLGEAHTEMDNSKNFLSYSSFASLPPVSTSSALIHSSKEWFGQKNTFSQFPTCTKCVGSAETNSSLVLELWC